MIAYWIVTSVLTILFYLFVAREFRLKDILTSVVWGWYVVPLVVFVVSGTFLLNWLVRKVEARK